MSKRRPSADRRGLLDGYDRTLLAVVPIAFRRLAGLWLLGLCVGLPAIVAVFR